MKIQKKLKNTNQQFRSLNIQLKQLKQTRRHNKFQPVTKFNPEQNKYGLPQLKYNKYNTVIKDSLQKNTVANFFNKSTSSNMRQQYIPIASSLHKINHIFGTKIQQYNLFKDTYTQIKKLKSHHEQSIRYSENDQNKVNQGINMPTDLYWKLMKSIKKKQSNKYHKYVNQSIEVNNNTSIPPITISRKLFHKKPLNNNNIDLEQNNQNLINKSPMRILNEIKEKKSFSQLKQQPHSKKQEKKVMMHTIMYGTNILFGYQKSKQKSTSQIGINKNNEIQTRIKRDLFTPWKKYEEEQQQNNDLLRDLYQ